MAKNISRWLAPRLQDVSTSQIYAETQQSEETLFSAFDDVPQRATESVPSIAPLDFFDVCRTYHFDDWCSIDGVGEKLSRTLYEFFHDEKKREMFQLLSEYGVFFA